MANHVDGLDDAWGDVPPMPRYAAEMLDENSKYVEVLAELARVTSERNAQGLTLVILCDMLNLPDNARTDKDLIRALGGFAYKEVI